MKFNLSFSVYLCISGSGLKILCLLQDHKYILVSHPLPKQLNSSSFYVYIYNSNRINFLYKTCGRSQSYFFMCISSCYSTDGEQNFFTELFWHLCDQSREYIHADLSSSFFLSTLMPE